MTNYEPALARVLDDVLPRETQDADWEQVLADAGRAEDDFARPPVSRPLWNRRKRTLTLAFAVVAIAVLVPLAALAVTQILSQPVQPPTPQIAVSFARLPVGWRQFPSTGGALATSWQYRPGPTAWALAFPRNGIVVRVFFVNSTQPYPTLRLRLPKSTAFTLEGSPTVREYRIHGRVRGHNVEVWVDIHRRRPTAPQLRVAQQVVSALRFRSPAHR